MLQASIAALALGFFVRNTPPDAETAAWPYLLGAYGFLAATAPWLAGGVAKSEFSLGYSVFLVFVFAAPLCLSAYWLWATPYRVISMAFLFLAALWLVHFGVSVALKIRGRLS